MKKARMCFLAIIIFLSGCAGSRTYFVDIELGQDAEATFLISLNLDKELEVKTDADGKLILTPKAVP